MKKKNGPDFSIESSYSGIVVSIDEAGRGPWAGPVVAGAVILKKKGAPKGINDSKLLSRTQREELYDRICNVAATSVGIATVEEIEQLNILGATKLAMVRAYMGLGVEAEIALIDGNQPPQLPCLTRYVIKGDSQCLSIGAASIIAKVTRDRMMSELAEAHPGYGWERNAGYGTRQHQDGILKHGLTPHHRRRWKPIMKILGEMPEETRTSQLELL